MKNTVSLHTKPTKGLEMTEDVHTTGFGRYIM